MFRRVFPIPWHILKFRSFAIPGALLHFRTCLIPVRFLNPTDSFHHRKLSSLPIIAACWFRKQDEVVGCVQGASSDSEEYEWKHTRVQRVVLRGAPGWGQ
jgi:hypothetical protein